MYFLFCKSSPLRRCWFSIHRYIIKEQRQKTIRHLSATTGVHLPAIQHSVTHSNWYKKTSIGSVFPVGGICPPVTFCVCFNVKRRIIICFPKEEFMIPTGKEMRRRRIYVEVKWFYYCCFYHGSA